MPKEKSQDMPILDHLEALRWHLIKSFASILAFAIIGFIFSNKLIDFLSLPIKNTEPPLELLNTTILGVFMAKMKVSIMAGIAFSIPVIAYQIWSFIAPGLLKEEKRYVPVFVGTTMINFTLGAAFSYFIMIPMSLTFFAVLNHGLPGLVNYVTLADYLSYITMLILFTGVAFELPILIYILAKLGLVSAEMLQNGRRFSTLIILLLSAIFTPADPFTMLGVAIPMIILYEVGIWVAKFVKSSKDTSNELEKITS
jgi:sec-independent protein translocase protein TatC